MPEPAAAPPNSHQRRYAAFLSYRHADNMEEGHRWAEWLHQALETYEVPRDLVGKPNLRGQPIPPSLYPIFRDEVELPADADLSDNIRRALEHSEALIVLCSPRACQSRFVAEEIRIFKELGKGERILALMIDGEPNAADDPIKHEQFGAAAECLPEPLRRGVKRADGTLDWGARTEPIAADARPGGRAEQGFTSASAYRTALEKSGISGPELRREVRAYAERLELARLKVTAGALSVPLGVLRDRDAAHRARKLRRLATAFGMFALLALAGGGVALSQRNRATAAEKATAGQRDRAVAAEKDTRRLAAEQAEQLKAISRSDYATGVDLIRGGQRRKGIIYLHRALETWPGNELAAFGLWEALVNAYGDLSPVPTHIVEHQSEAGADAAQPGSAIFSPDGQRFAAIADAGIIKVWETATGRAVLTISANESANSLAFSPDGTRLLGAGDDDFARVWDTATGAEQLAVNVNGVGWLAALAFAPDGRSFATDFGESAAIWDAQTGEQRDTFAPGTGFVCCLAFSPDGNTLAIGDSGRSVTLWDVATAELIHSLEGHESRIRSLAFSADGATLLTTSDDGSARFWHVGTGDLLHTLIRQSAPLGPVAASPDGRWWLTGHRDGSARLWNARTLEPGLVLRGHEDAVTSVAFSPDGKWLLTGGQDGRTMLWAMSSRESMLFQEHEGDILSSALSVDGEWALTGGEDHSARLWETTGCRELQVLRGHSNVVTAVAISPDKQRLLTGSADRTAIVWDPASGEKVASLVGHTASINALEFTPDGTQALTASFDGTVRLWDAATGGELLVFRGHTKAVMCVALSPDGKRAATGNVWEPTKLWDLQTGREISEMPSASQLAFSPTGEELILCAPGGSPVCHDGRTGEQRWGGLFSVAKVHPENIHALAVSRDGRLFSSSEDGLSVVSLMEDGAPVGELLRSGERAIGRAVSLDGRRVLTIKNVRSDFLFVPGTGRVTDLPESLGPLPDWMPNLIRIATGFEFVFGQAELSEHNVDFLYDIYRSLPRSSPEDRHGWGRLLEAVGR